MGLNLLEVLPVRLPSLDVDVRGLHAPPLLQVQHPLQSCLSHYSDKCKATLFVVSKPTSRHCITLHCKAHGSAP